MIHSSKMKLSYALLTMAVVLSACSGGNNAKPTNGSSASPSASPSATASATSSASASPAASEETEADLQFGKYDPPIEVSTVRAVGSDLKFPEGQSWEDNVWTRKLMDSLGIKLKHQWIVNTDQGTEKMNISIASGNLPDFFSVSATQLSQLVEAGQIMDMTEIYQKHASPTFKKYTESVTNGLATATFDGKMMALPTGQATSDSAPLLWIRRDWLKKLDLPEPKTMADVLAISDAFTNQDPDGNNKKDSYGLAVNKTLLMYNGGQAFGSLEGFFNSYHAYPQSWIKGEDGKLVYGSIQPEMKQALASLQQMYKNGQIDKEFGVKGDAKVLALASAGKLGMAYGPMFFSLTLLDSRKNDPNADWQAYPIVSIDDQAAYSQTQANAISDYYVINKNAKNPEAMFKMINVSVDMDTNPNVSQEEYEELNYVDGIEVWQYFPFFVVNPNKNLEVHKKVVTALDSKDTTGLNQEQLDAYKNSLAMEEGTGDATNWGMSKVFGREGSYSVIDKLLSANLFKPSEFIKSPTKTMTIKNATLQKLEIQTYTKIIMGESLDSFDKFVEDWKKLGGDQITVEVNEAMQ
ncbi:extracellular solute-binding protein [Cohnella sp. LGH]|uniref:extracellular solute-binding protein n=1 Tax=Cohnella sp. LGH TaxID=1619153 RepID=UPI001ADA7EAA|nr:extracellular solute-binding protein [Cohnella sp. LGH]QTH43242.1 extracellular solute-binding protein [Cohnella sp. LGH]